MPVGRVRDVAACGTAIVTLVFVSQMSGQGNPAATGNANAALVDDLVTANHILSNEAIVDGLGHISVRLERADRFLVSRDLPPSLVTAADFIEYNLDGSPVNPNGPRGYTERFIHAAIYKARPDVRSVIHAHTPSVLPFTVSSVALRPVYHIAPFLLPGVPVWDIRSVTGFQGMLVSDLRSADTLAATLADKAIVLMRGHGFVTLGESVPEAVQRAIVTDVSARVQTQATALGGTIRYLSGADVPDGGTKVQAAPPNEVARNWAYWKDRATRR